MSFQPPFRTVFTPSFQNPIDFSPLYESSTSNDSNGGIMPSIDTNDMSVLQTRPVRNNRAMMAGNPMFLYVPASAIKLPTMHMSTSISNPRLQKENTIPSSSNMNVSVFDTKPSILPSETYICPIPSVINDEHSSLNKKQHASYNYNELLLQHNFDIDENGCSSSSTSLPLTIHHTNGSPCIPKFIPHPPTLQSCTYNTYEHMFHGNDCGLQSIDVMSVLLQKRAQNKISTDLYAVEKKRFLERTPVPKAMKPKTGYHYFAKDIREYEPLLIQGYSASMQSKLISVKWKKLNQFTKDRYLKMGDPEKKKYAEDNDKYKEYVKDAEAIGIVLDAEDTRKDVPYQRIKALLAINRDLPIIAKDAQYLINKSVDKFIEFFGECVCMLVKELSAHESEKLVITERDCYDAMEMCHQFNFARTALKRPDFDRKEQLSIKCKSKSRSESKRKRMMVKEKYVENEELMIVHSNPPLISKLSRKRRKLDFGQTIFGNMISLNSLIDHQISYPSAITDSSLTSNTSLYPLLPTIISSDHRNGLYLNSIIANGPTLAGNTASMGNVMEVSHDSNAMSAVFPNSNQIMPSLNM